jgi:hypothetical protein
MAKMNLLASIQVYKDTSPTNNPLQSTANWTSSHSGIEVDETETRNLKVASKQTEVLFSYEIETGLDSTTSFDLSKKSGVLNTYTLSHNSGTVPSFRDERGIDVDETTEFTITKSGALVTFTHSGGQAPDLSSAQFGDEVKIGSQFNMFNQGKFQLLNKTTDSFTIENMLGTVETVILGSSFEEQLSIYSASGVQIGQKIKISNNFVNYSHGVYEITDVAPDYLEFSAAKDLPEEQNVLANIVVYNNSKSFIYVEYDKNCTLVINGVEMHDLKPLSIGSKKAPGIFMRSGDMYSAFIQNNSLDLMSTLVISAE